MKYYFLVDISSMLEHEQYDTGKGVLTLSSYLLTLSSYLLTLSS